MSWPVSGSYRHINRSYFCRPLRVAINHSERRVALAMDPEHVKHILGALMEEEGLGASKTSILTDRCTHTHTTAHSRQCYSQGGVKGYRWPRHKAQERGGGLWWYSVWERRAVLPCTNGTRVVCQRSVWKGWWWFGSSWRTHGRPDTRTHTASMHKHTVWMQTQDTFV